MIEEKLLVSLSCLAMASSAIAQERPNIIMIMCDDLGWGDVGFNGNEIIQTPCLDHLSKEGIIFDRFYAGSAVSSPTRASVLTGRNPFRTGVFNANAGILRPEEITLPELLLQQGYYTGHFGKWHLGSLTHEEKDANRGKIGNTALFNPPREHGYIESFTTESKVPTYDPMKRPKKSDDTFWDAMDPKDEGISFGTSYWKHNGEKETENLEGDDSRIIMDRVLPFIQKSKEADRPFLSVIWFHTPHIPYVASPEHAATYKDYPMQERNYFGAISGMDEQVGRLVDYLKQEGLYENTILCFCSDNGPGQQTPGTAAHLRGRKFQLYEGGVRVPAFVVWPGKIPAGKRTDRIVSVCDYLPTFVDLLSLLDSPYELDGESLMGFFKKEAPREKPIVILLKKSATVIEQQYKLYYQNGQYELYDIEKDPSETKDLASKYPKIVKRLNGYLDKRIEQINHSFEGEEYGRHSRERVKQNWVDVKQ